MDNSKDAIEARKMICEKLRIAAEGISMALEDQDAVVDAMLFCGAANRSGGKKNEEIARISEWFHEISIRSNLLALYLSGMIDVAIANDGAEPMISLTDGAVAKLKGANGVPSDALSESGGWCGCFVESEAANELP